MFTNISPKQKTWIGITFVLVLLIYPTAITISRLDEIAVKIEVIPENSIVRIDGIEHGSDTIYLNPGKHVFLAKASGFKDDEQIVEINKSNKYVGLIPDPVSNSAKKLFIQDRNLQTKREAIGGLRANNRGVQLENKYPIITKLPRIDITGPYAIDFGYSKDSSESIYLIINDSSPQGRERALKWIKKQGYNPADLDIRYDDYINPLLKAKQ